MSRCYARDGRAPLEKFPGGGDVALYLFAQRNEGGKLLFVAQFSGEDYLQFLTVDVAGEIQQMNLHADVRRGVRNSGTASDV